MNLICMCGGCPSCLQEQGYEERGYKMPYTEPVPANIQPIEEHICHVCDYAHGEDCDIQF